MSSAMDEFKGTENDDLKPSSSFVTPLLTDMYQITMAYAYFVQGKENVDSVFDLFFRENPFSGEFTLFAGLEQVLRFVHSFKFSAEEIAFLKTRFPTWKPEFWKYLAELTTKDVKIHAMREGSVVFPRIPLIRVEGPLGICQMLETTLLVLVNYASLVCTNAARYRLAVGSSKQLLEFGLRRAQGPDGAMSASRYCYIGGFDATSNVLASQLFGINMQGTHAHSFVVAFQSLEDLSMETIADPAGKIVNFLDICLKYRKELGQGRTNGGELAAYVAYAQAFPTSFTALVDTYDVLNSGVWNYCVVALALIEIGYSPLGIRLDSGDLSYLSIECRNILKSVDERYNLEGKIAKSLILASNNLSESVLYALDEQGHEIDAFGIGTNLVTCQNQPALGCVYKLVECDGHPRIKISQELTKVVIPGKKMVYRLFNKKMEPILDLMVMAGSAVPTAHKRVMCRHPFEANKRVNVTPSKVLPLLECVWDGKLTGPFPSLSERRAFVQAGIKQIRSDHLRRLNPTPYKIAVTSDLYTYMHDLWLAETPIAELE